LLVHERIENINKNSFQMFETSLITEPYQSVCQDLVAVFTEAQRTVVLVADGAGGIRSGEQAAKTVVEEVRLAFPHLDSAEAWCNLLGQIDQRIGSGETTAVVVDLRKDSLCGASVGDSQAWIVKGVEITNLTARQKHKPLLGSREAVPVGFAQGRLDGVLLVATDGFCNYVKRSEIVKVLPYEDFALLPKRLIDLVRLRSGKLNDDVGLVFCRYRRPARNSKKAFTLE
jgi:PPM family protein phosphatase